MIVHKGFTKNFFPMVFLDQDSRQTEKFRQEIQSGIYLTVIFQFPKLLFSFCIMHSNIKSFIANEFTGFLQAYI